MTGESTPTSTPTAKPTRTVRLNRNGLDQLDEIAADHGVSLREYMEALMQFAISQHKRPGSWEAQGFDFATYSKQRGHYADRWF